MPSLLLFLLVWALIVPLVSSGVQLVSANDHNATSAVIQVNETHREGYLMVLLPSSRQLGEERVLYEFRIYVQVSAFLALRHVQQRSGEVLPFLPERLKQCDFDFKYRFHDTMFSPLQAGRHVFQENVYGMNRNERRQCGSSAGIIDDPAPAIEEESSSLSDPGKMTDSDTGTATFTIIENMDPTSAPFHPKVIKPFAALGSARSAVSRVISALGYAYQLPQISPISTSTALDYAPLFARTIPTSDGESMAIMAYLDSLGVGKCAIFYLKDEWGSYYRSNVEAAARPYNIDVTSVPYVESDIEYSLKMLASTNLRYIVGIISPSNWKPVVRLAYEFQMIGNPSFQWFFGSIGALTAESFTLDGTTEWDVARAIYGAAIVSSTPAQNDFQAAHGKAMQDFAKNQELQQEFVCQYQAEPDMFEDFEFRPPGRSLFHYLAYDAVMALALTACETPGLFTGEEFYNRLLEIDFGGVSGKVQLHNRTGTRLRETLRYRIGNIRIDYDKVQATIMERIPMISTTSALVDIPPVGSSTEAAVVEIVQPWIYNDNSTNPPRVLPPLEEELNLVPNGSLCFGYILAGLTMLLSVGWAVWVYWNRNEYVVRASQPIFLGQLCVGTFTMAASVIPLSFQEDMPGLDAACMAVPWLLCCGFTIAFSALYTKTLRVHKLMSSGTGFRRVTIEPKHVIRTFVILMTLNVALLTAWTASSHALEWERIEKENVDEFGRNVESYGQCRGDKAHAFAIPLVVINLFLLALATYQSYIARNLPTEFAETEYLFLSMVSLSEVLIMGGPILFVVDDDPSAFFLVMSAIVCISCMAILMPMFVPKFVNHDAQNQSGLGSRIKRTVQAKRSAQQATPTKSASVSQEAPQRDIGS